MEKKTRKPDRRVTRTKKAIKDAFLSLLSEKDISEITVKSVAEIANVDRKTIYNYYDGLYAILEALEDEFVKRIDESVNYIEGVINTTALLFDKIVEVFENNLDFYSKIMKIKSNSQLNKKLVSVLEDKITKLLIKYKIVEEDKASITTVFYLQGFIEVYQKWFDSDRSISLNELSHYCGELVIRGLKV